MSAEQRESLEPEDTEGQKVHSQVDRAGGDDTEGHKVHSQIDPADGDDTEGHQVHSR